MATATATNGDNDITLRDVVNHMSHINGVLTKNMSEMKKELSGKIDNLGTRIDRVEKRLTGVEEGMKTLQTELTERIDALQEDLTATIKDTIKIRKYVGMALPDEE